MCFYSKKIIIGMYLTITNHHCKQRPVYIKIHDAEEHAAQENLSALTCKSSFLGKICLHGGKSAECLHPLSEVNISAAYHQAHCWLLLPAWHVRIQTIPAGIVNCETLLWSHLATETQPLQIILVWHPAGILVALLEPSLQSAIRICPTHEWKSLI